MGFIDYIERTREKPHHVRQRVAVTWALAITAVIFLGWLSALPFILGSSSTEIAVKTVSPSRQVHNTINEVGDRITRGWGRMLGAVGFE